MECRKFQPSIYFDSMSKRHRESTGEAVEDEIERIQGQLLQIDQMCVEEQLDIQKRYDAKKHPLFGKRDRLIEGIAGFYSKVFENHPLVECSEDDLNILKHMRLIRMTETEDRYEIDFIFDESNPYFSNASIIHTMSLDPSVSSEEASTVSSVQWAGENRLGSLSFIDWITGKRRDDSLAEIIRTDIYQNPFAYYMNISLI